MTAKEGLARLRAVRETLGEPGEWPGVVAEPSEILGCIAQRAGATGVGTWLTIGLTYQQLWPIVRAYDSRDPVALDAALDELEREIAANE